MSGKQLFIFGLVTVLIGAVLAPIGVFCVVFEVAKDKNWPDVIAWVGALSALAGGISLNTHSKHMRRERAEFFRRISH